MGDPPEKRTFTPESLLTQAVETGKMHELDRHAAFESAVVATREPHCTHTASAERPFQFVGADSLSRERWQRVVHERRFVEKRRSEHPIVLEQEALDRVSDVGLFGAHTVEQCCATVRVEIQCPIGQRAHRLPQPRVPMTHDDPSGRSSIAKSAMRLHHPRSFILGMD